MGCAPATVMATRMRRLLLLPFFFLVACGGERPPKELPQVSLWHTFGPQATELLNRDLEAIERQEKLHVRATVLPFGRARNQVTRTLEESSDPTPSCPDLVRVDATWVPLLARAGLLRPLSDEATALQGFTPEAVELVEWSGQRWGLPQAIEPLALLYDADTIARAGVAWPPASLTALEEAARKLTHDGHYGLSVRADGYFFLAWLRATGADLPAIDDPAARAALARYGALVATGGVAPPAVAGEDEARDEAERLARREVAIIVGGPFSVVHLGALPFALAVAPFPRDPEGRPAAPRGGHVYVVPRCAASPERAIRVAQLLTSPERQVAWSRAITLVPTRTQALAKTEGLARGFADAIAATRPLPREPSTPDLFDDLTPAVEAVLFGEATADEVLPGVARAWRRVLARHARAPHPGAKQP